MSEECGAGPDSVKLLHGRFAKINEHQVHVIEQKLWAISVSGEVTQPFHRVADHKVGTIQSDHRESMSWNLVWACFPHQRSPIFEVRRGHESHISAGAATHIDDPAAFREPPHELQKFINNWLVLRVICVLFCGCVVDLCCVFQNLPGIQLLHYSGRCLIKPILLFRIFAV